jgi:hypothetical protein
MHSPSPVFPTIREAWTSFCTNFAKFGSTGPVISGSEAVPPELCNLNKRISCYERTLLKGARQSVTLQQEKGYFPCFPSDPRQ